MNFLLFFFEFSITGRVGTHWNDFFFSLLLRISQLIFSFSRPSPTYFASKSSHNSVFYFLGIFYYGSGRNSSEWLFFFSLFLGHSQLILAWKVAKMLVFNFLNFFAIFFEFSITGQVRTHRNDFFLFWFSLFLGLPQLILAWKEATMVFFNFFWIFLLLFLNFLLRVW